MALRLSGRFMISQVMPSCFSTRIVSYFFVVIVVSRFLKRAPCGGRGQDGPEDWSGASGLGRYLRLDHESFERACCWAASSAIHIRGWRLREYATRSCNRSFTNKRALSLQVRDPHDCGHVPHIGRLLFCVLVAGPDEVLFCRERLPFLIEEKLSLRDMADHGVLHGGARGLRSGLHDDIAHGDRLKAGDHGWCFAIISTHHDTGPRRRILVARGLSCGWLHNGRRSRC